VQGLRLPGMVATGALLAVLVAGRADGLALRSCVSQDGSGPCTAVLSNTVTTSYALVPSPDGRFVYHAARFGGAVGIFAVDQSSGALSLVGCAGHLLPQPCSDWGMGGPIGPSALALSPDGQNLYVTGDDGGDLATFARDPQTGLLTYESCLSTGGQGSCTSINDNALTSPRAVVMSADGRNLYVASINGDAITVFNRDTDTGAIVFAGCVSGTGAGPCTDIGVPRALDGALDLLLGPDGKQLYATASTGDAVSVFTRNTTTGEIAYASCIGSSGAGCAAAPVSAALDGAAELAMSADGAQLYVTATNGDALAVLTRDGTTGALGFAGCVSDATAGSCSSLDNTHALDAPVGVVLSPDGTRLYAAASQGNAVAAFARAADGALSFRGCLGSDGGGPCVSGANSAAFTGAFTLAAGPDGAHLWEGATVGGAIATIGTQAVSCSTVTATTARGTAVKVPLGCADPDGGDALSLTVGQPAHGQVGAVDPATQTVLYAPDPGFAGIDGFDVAAADIEGSASGRVTIEVAAPPAGGNPGGSGGGDTTAPALSASLSRKRFRVGRTATAVSAKRAPAGTRVRWRVSEAATIRASFRRCRTARCRRTVPEGRLTRRARAGSGGLTFSGRIGRRALRPGRHRATLTATDAAGNRSKAVVLTFRIVRR